MSLVEKALEKMQKARAEAAAQELLQSAGTALKAAPAARVGAGWLHEPEPLPPAKPPARTLLVDPVALRGAGLLPPESNEREIAAQFRMIKRPLIAAATGRGGQRVKDGHLIMVSSALPGEGKTFTSVNLAMSLALERDITVLLVDADVPKPNITQVLRAENEPGLLDVLADETLPVESVILPTDVQGLSFLPAGRHLSTAAELLASARMQSVIARIMSRDPNCIVLFDTPPALLRNESQSLVNFVGQVVLVVRAGHTPQDAVMSAIRLAGEGRHIGLVLNQSSDGPDDLYYGNRYGKYGDRA